MHEYYITKDELYHHGIKGQKWGERRFQNEDGSLTAAGRERYGLSNLKSIVSTRQQKPPKFSKVDGPSEHKSKYSGENKPKLPSVDEIKRMKKNSKEFKEAVKTITDSKMTTKQKAKKLSEIGAHNESADLYRKDFSNKKKALFIGSIAFSAAKSVGSNYLANKVRTGQMSFETGANISKAIGLGKTAVQAYMVGSMIDSARKHDQEYWKF